MRLPEEFIVKEVIPYIRARLIHHLFLEKKISQREIARLLWIQQPTVSKIIRTKQGTLQDQSFFDEEEINEFISNTIDKILSQEWKPTDFIHDVQKLIWKSLMGGTLCQHHKALYPELRELQCDACFRLFSDTSGLGTERDKLRQALKQCYLTLKDIPEIIELIPEVRTNIVASGLQANSLEDVVAFPGRITIHRNSLKIFDDPEFGASKHLGSLLLKIRKHFPQVRCGTCIRYDQRIYRFLTSMNASMVTIPRNQENQKEHAVLIHLLDQIVVNLQRRKFKTPIFLIDPGSLGLEPVTYIFHHDLNELTYLLIDIAKAIHKNGQDARFHEIKEKRKHEEEHD